MEIQIRVLPGASKNQVVGLIDGVWKVRLTAPPVDGKANQALLNYLAEKLGINHSQIRLLKGATSRTKTLSIHGLNETEVAARLSGV
jgi:uncharacterized protein (TIGR00251 family)